MGNRNSGFQSVVPLAANGMVQPGSSASSPPNRKKSLSKTAPAPFEAETPVSPVLVIPHDVSETIPVGSQSSLARSEPPVNEALISVDGFDFRQTETQLRRKGMADCEFECSQIEPYLFVGGYHVAGNWELLKSNGITRVVNLSSAVVNSHFISDPAMSYYTVNMVDGRQDDISWFVCDVVQFIIKGRTLGEKTLIHCEKGVSRSCSFAIAYRMWSSGEKWKAAFDYVKERRPVCAPNTAFTCNLIEMGEIFGGAPNTRNLLFRCAFHLPHDPLTAVLKLCRNNESRKILAPSSSLLDPKGVFVIRCTRDNTNDQLVFIWKGTQASVEALEKAKILAQHMYGIVTNTHDINLEEQGCESQLFLSTIISDGQFGNSDVSLEGSGTFRPSPPFEDLYDLKPSMEAALVFQKEHEQLRLSRDKPVMLTAKQSSIQGFDTSSETEYFKGSDPHESPSEFVGKLAKIPSLKLSDAALVGSRRNSHSKPVVLSRASSIRRDSKSEVDISGGSTALSLNLGSLSSANPVVPLLESPSGSRRDRDDARGLKFTSPIKEASFNDDSPRSDVSSIPSARQGAPDKVGPVPAVQSVEATPRGIVLESARSDPPMSHRGIRFNEPEQPSSADKKADDIKRAEPVSSSSSSSQHQGETSHQELHKNSSRSRLLSLLSGGTAERPSSASEHKTLFRNNSRVVPLLDAIPAPAETDRKLSNATDNTHPTHEMSRLTSPASPSEDKVSVRNTQPVDATPKKPMTALQLPTSALLRTPSVEKHPEHVSLSRGPTPAEELTVPMSNRDHGTMVPRLSLNKISNPVSPQLTKPTLFQAVVKKTSKRGDSLYEWQAMGVYDDDDLNETNLLLLLCPDLNHFVWIGAEFDVDKAGILVDSDAELPSDDEITRWVATVLNGEVKFDNMTGKQLTRRLRICRSGEESEDFWTAFNAGF